MVRRVPARPRIGGAAPAWGSGTRWISNRFVPSSSSGRPAVIAIRSPDWATPYSRARAMRGGALPLLRSVRVLCEALCRSYNVRKLTDLAQVEKRAQDSVRIGLNKVRTDWVLVHDGARPFVSEEMVNELLESAQRHGAAVLGVPVKDTMKKVNVDGIIEETPERQSMWAVQTPQAFRLSELKRAHARAREEELAATDDAMLMEHLGFDVRIVRGDYYNIKITTPEDLCCKVSVATHAQNGRSNIMRVGQGFDVHRLTEGRPLIVGGVHIPYAKGLDGR